MGWSDVERAFGEAVERGAIPGAAVVVRVGADIAFEGAFGFRSLAPEKTPMKIETVFDLSSLTKALATTVAVMMLTRDGKLRLDEMVSAHLPLERVEDAFSLMASGSVIRTVLELQTGGCRRDHAVSRQPAGAE